MSKYWHRKMRYTTNIQYMTKTLLSNLKEITDDERPDPGCEREIQQKKTLKRMREILEIKSSISQIQNTAESPNKWTNQEEKISEL